jgi:hypothetical protein
VGLHLEGEFYTKWLSLPKREGGMIMAPVFNREVVTTTSCRGTDTYIDRDIDIQGSAGNWKGIAGFNFLPTWELDTEVFAEQKGNLFLVDEVYIKWGDQSVQVPNGDRLLKIHGDHLVEIDRNLSTTIHGEEAHNVKQGRKTVISNTMGFADEPADDLEVHGNRRAMIRKNDNWTVQGACQKTIHGGELDNEVTKLLDRYADIIGFGNGSGSAQGAKVEARGTNNELAVFNAELAAIDAKMDVAEPNLGVGWFEIAVAKIITGGWSNKFDGPGT